MSELSTQLKDLHLPDPVSVWPLAPGWWVIAASAAFLSLRLGVLLYRRWRERGLGSKLRKELNQHYAHWQQRQQDSDYYHACASALRRTAITHSGRDRVARLSGAAWVDWLDAQAQTPFPEAIRQLLADAIYQRKPPARVPMLHAELLRWSKDIRQPVGL